MSAEERTGFRDLDLSLRHRQWGHNCPSVDIDFVLAEYDRGKTCAVVEYKHFRAERIGIAHKSIRPYVDLCENRWEPIPLMIVRYWPDSWGFQVMPVNKIAHDIYGSMPGFDGQSVSLTERDYVSSLYQLRGRPLGHDICELNTILPPPTALSLMQ